MAGRLTALKVQKAKPGKYSDGGNLYLLVAASGSKKWVFRFTYDGRPKEMGLGGAQSVSLADARERADEARRAVAKGINPIDARKATIAMPTFGEMADIVCETLAAGFRNKKHISQWKNTLSMYATSLKNMPVHDVDTDRVLAVLRPIWSSKAETASRVRGRIERVLDAAKAKGFRSGENPARWRGHLDHLLPKQSKLARGHHAAMPYRDLPTFIASLREHPSVAAYALEFTILTAGRTGEIIGARWSEINFLTKVWTIPAERMKAGRVHTVPLSDRAMHILIQARQLGDQEFIFPGQRTGRPLSNMAMDAVLRRMKIEVTVHGFRSSFRDWAGNETEFPRELIETALAHVIGDKAEQAYRRSDALERRRKIMDAWSGFIGAA